MSLTSVLGECRVLPQLSFGAAEAPGQFLEDPSPQPMAGLGSARHEQIFLPLLLLSPRNTTGSGTPPLTPSFLLRLDFCNCLLDVFPSASSGHQEPKAFGSGARCWHG